MANKFTEKHRLVLAKALKKYGNPEGIENIYELEGFLVGILCCPERVDMDDMMFVIFGPEEASYPEWGNESEIGSFYDSLFALQNKNNGLLRCAAYKPKLLKYKKDQKKWCKGFVKGFGEEGFDAAERFNDDEVIQAFLIFLWATCGIDLSELVPEITKEYNEKITEIITNVTTKRLGQFTQHLFLKIHQESYCDYCDGGHHHKH